MPIKKRNPSIDQLYQNLSDPFKGTKGYQTEEISDKQIVSLNSNENLVYPLDILQKQLREIIETIDLRIYPESHGQSLCKKIAERNSLFPDQIVIANGSDAIIDVIVRMSIEAGDRVSIINPTFSMYEHSARVRGGTVKNLYLTEAPKFDLDLDSILVELTPKKNKLLFLCNPNNPTGKQYAKEKIETILREYPGIIALDEAYADFGRYSFANRVDEFQNLIVLKTFSKLYGLAGIRIGYSLSSEFLANRMKTILPYYNVNAIAIELAKKIFAEQQITADVRDYIVRERERVYNELLKIKGITPYKSDANFIMFKTKIIPQKKLFQELKNRGMLLRDLSKFPLCKDCLRVTITTEENNNFFLNSLRNL